MRVLYLSHGSHEGTLVDVALDLLHEGLLVGWVQLLGELDRLQGSEAAPHAVYYRNTLGLGRGQAWKTRTDGSVVPYCGRSVTIGASQTAFVAACHCRGISDPAFQLFPWLSVIKNRFHACESEVEMSKNCINPPLVSSVCSCLHPCVAAQPFFQFSDHQGGLAQK